MDHLERPRAEFRSLVRQSPINVLHREVAEVKAPVNRYEIGYSAELADDTSAVFTPGELADNGIALMI